MASANFGDGTSRINPQLWTTLQRTLLAIGSVLLATSLLGKLFEGGKH